MISLVAVSHLIEFRNLEMNGISLTWHLDARRMLQAFSCTLLPPLVTIMPVSGQSLASGWLKHYFSVPCSPCTCHQGKYVGDTVFAVESMKRYHSTSWAYQGLGQRHTKERRCYKNYEDLKSLFIRGKAEHSLRLEMNSTHFSSLTATDNRVSFNKRLNQVKVRNDK